MIIVIQPCLREYQEIGLQFDSVRTYICDMSVGGGGGGSGGSGRSARCGISWSAPKAIGVRPRPRPRSRPHTEKNQTRTGLACCSHVARSGISWSAPKAIG
ncbi:hypothetical protein PV325_012833, partial [Microctonus aethiopoides]